MVYEPTLSREDKGNYEGEVDKDGRRIGVGKCSWGDKSYYNGDWV